MIQLVCLILSVIFAALACSGIPQHPRFHFLSAAVAMLALSFIFSAVPAIR